jgi:hypothetical protein
VGVDILWAMGDGVQIQTDQVGDFGKGLRKDADGGFATAAGRGADLHRQGVGLGWKISAGPIMEVKQKYASALAATDANLRVYPVAAGILADVAEEVARRFAHADKTSAVTQQEIQTMLSGAITHAQSLIDQAQNMGRGLQP